MADEENIKLIYRDDVKKAIDDILLCNESIDRLGEKEFYSSEALEEIMKLLDSILPWEYVPRVEKIKKCKGGNQ